MDADSGAEPLLVGIQAQLLIDGRSTGGPGRDDLSGAAVLDPLHFGLEGLDLGLLDLQLQFLRLEGTHQHARVGVEVHPVCVVPGLTIVFERILTVVPPTSAELT